MKNFLLLFLLLITFSSIYSQSTNSMVLKGTTYDKSINESLPFVVLALKNSQKGTTSDEVGKFELEIPAEAKNDTLLVSMIGYKKFFIPVSEIKDFNDLKVYLEPTTFSLNEVTIYSSNHLNIVKTPCFLSKFKQSELGDIATITFINNQDEDVKVVWLNYSGEEIDYKNLDSGKGFTKKTWTNHPYMIQDTEGNCLGIFEAKKKGKAQVMLE